MPKKNLKPVDFIYPSFQCPKEMYSRRPSPIRTFVKKKTNNFGPDLAGTS